MAYTIHIQYHNDSSSSDNNLGNVSDISEDLKERHLITRRKQSRSVSPTKRSYQTTAIPSRRHSSKRKSTTPSSKSILSNLPSSNPDPEQQSSSLALSLSSFHDIKPLPTTPPRTQLPDDSSTTLALLNSSSHIICKRSLTLLSAEKFTTQNPRTTKKYHNIVNISPDAEPDSPHDNGSTTSEDPPST